jgi:Tol biopolymer transport system component
VRASNDAWAVGTVIDPITGRSIALVLHWNGSSWSQVVITAQTNRENLLSVVSTGIGTALAVGATSDRPLVVQLSTHGGSSVALPSSVNSQLTPLRAITRVSANDIWAVGGTVIVHWNGSQWSQIAAPTLKQFDNLHALGALGTSAVWAVGDNSFGSIILQWDGGSWKPLPGPDPNEGYFYVTGVAPISAHDLWIVGYTSLHGYAFHYDGIAWRDVSPSGGWLESIAALPQGELFVAGRLPVAEGGSSIFRLQPALGFAGSTLSGTPANGLITVPVQLSSTVPQTVTVAYTVAGGSALPSSDYTPSTGVLTIPPCSQSQAIPISVQSGADWSTLKTIGLTVHDPQGSALATASASLTVIAPDQLPSQGVAYLPLLARPQRSGRIAFASNRDGQAEIYSINPDGTDLRRLTNNPSSDFGPAWSPDGTQIAFTSGRAGGAQIFVMRADGSNVRQLTFGGSENTWPSWSPDGTRIAFVSDRERSKTTVFDLIYMMQADGSQQTRVTARVNNQINPRDNQPAWSPDGSQIVFISQREVTALPQLYTVRLDGSQPRRLATFPYGAERPMWSPDGTQLLVGSSLTTTYFMPHELFVLSADGQQVAQINPSYPTGAYGDWSPDGTQIVYSNISTISVVGFDQRAPRPLTGSNIDPHDVYPVWSRH